MVAGVVGIPIFFLLLITIGPGDQSFCGLQNMMDQVASYQFVGEGMSPTAVQLCWCFHVLSSLSGQGFVAMPDKGTTYWYSVHPGSVELPIACLGCCVVHLWLVEKLWSTSCTFACSILWRSGTTVFP